MTRFLVALGRFWVMAAVVCTVLAMLSIAALNLLASPDHRQAYSTTRGE
jgi:hypothetical protein